MEAAPRLPMISFELKTSTDPANFAPKLKQYIASFYHEDPESYNNEIHNLESLRAFAVRPAIDVAGVQALKSYYCQLNFLKSRFPMEKGQTCAVAFSWKDIYANLGCTLSDIDFELSCILYNIGSLHSQLGATDSRSSSEGMKMSCTHFQCAAWAFQHLKNNYSQLVSLYLVPEVVHFMYQLCLAQAQECILEKSMMDNRKATIIAKVAVQVVEYYNQALATLMSGTDEGTMGEIVGNRVFRVWSRYLKFKVAYHSSVSFLYQGQQAEEAQKMGERVAYYQAASEQLEEARKIAKESKGVMGQQQHEVDEALGFTQDVVEGKKKAAKNENEFIYHEVVPEKDALQQVNGVSLVKGIPFSVNDPDVSGSDLFQRLVPMEAHEASSVYSEQKAEMLRQIMAIVDTKDAELVEFMSSLQLDCLNQFKQAIGVPQDVVDRAAAICAKPQVTQALVDIMGKLAGTCSEVETVLGEIQAMIKEEESKEHEYQKIIGNRPPSLISTDLTREAGKYSEAHSKANESNQTLHRAMTMHMANLKILGQPISELKKTIPCTMANDPSIDEALLKELETLIAKVDEMRIQRTTLVTQLREAVCADDITARLVTKLANITMEQLFQTELTKHKQQAALIEQNLAAQDNILSALTDIYARFAPIRRYMIDVIKKREQITAALIASYDAYDDLLAKANKGIEFYQKLEGNVTKLLQRVKGACKVNEEEREQMLAKTGASIIPAPSVKIPVNSGASSTPKLKDYLASMRTSSNTDIAATNNPSQWVPPSVRPTPLGSEETSDKRLQFDISHAAQIAQANNSANIPYQYNYANPNMCYQYPVSAPTNPELPQTPTYSAPAPNPQNYQVPPVPANYPTSQQTPYYNTNQSGYYTPQDTAQIPYSANAYYPPVSDPKPIPQVPVPYPEPSQMPPASYPVNPATYYSDAAAVAAMAGIYQASQLPMSYHLANTYCSDSYTPASTPQQNYATPAAYSPCLDTSAPSQKLLQEYQHPAGYRSSAENYPAAGYPTYTQTATMYNPTAVSTAAYTYPAIQDPAVAGYGNQYPQHQQYQAPNEEYQQQYQYIPQYYSTNATASPAPTVQYTNAGTAANYQSGAGMAQNTVVTEASQSNYYTAPYGHQTIGMNPMTVVQANNKSASTPKGGSSSNLDLLAGLDFSGGQAPLQPERRQSLTVMSPLEQSKNITEPVNKTSNVVQNVPVETKDKTPIKTECEEKMEIDGVKVEDPLADSDVLANFSQEIDKLEKFVDGLTTKTLNGPTPLDIKWKEIQEQQERDSQKCSISVARCYPMKNRFPDIMPYDQFRVELPSTKDDYINASYVKNASKSSPNFIVTQAPLKSTLDDFWTMVWEQQVEVMVCLLGETDMKDAAVYWPLERGSELTIGKYRIVLQNHNAREYWIERVISINDGVKQHVVVHIQFTAWPGSGLFPNTVFPLISLASAVLGCHRQQRTKSRPILIHCLSGLGRSGLLCVLIAAMCDPLQMIDVYAAACRISRCRKNILRDREHLKFTYQAVLQHMRDIISGKQLQSKIQGVQGIVSAPEEPSSSRCSSLSDQSEPSKQRKKFTPESFVALKEQGISSTDASDPLSALDPLWTMKK